MEFHTWTYYVFDQNKGYPFADDKTDVTSNLNLIALGAEYWLDILLPEDTPSGPGGNSMKDLIMKIVMCANPGGATPFYNQSVLNWYWGYWDDPFLVSIKSIMMAMNQSVDDFTTSVPGIVSNLTSKADTLRRSNRDRTHTGKDDVKKAGKYVFYQNMTQMYVCLNAAGSGREWDEEGHEWPACNYYQADWTEKQANEKGWTKMWATDWANRISGTDCSLFPREVRQDRIECFIDDIYRSSYVEFKQHHDVSGVSTRSYGLIMDDMKNNSVVPTNWQWYQFGASGMSNFTSAAGVPMFASKPHFLDGQVLDPLTVLHSFNIFIGRF